MSLDPEIAFFLDRKTVKSMFAIIHKMYPKADKETKKRLKQLEIYKKASDL